MKYLRVEGTVLLSAMVVLDLVNKKHQRLIVLLHLRVGATAVSSSPSLPPSLPSSLPLLPAHTRWHIHYAGQCPVRGGAGLTLGSERSPPGRT